MDAKLSRAQMTGREAVRLTRHTFKTIGLVTGCVTTINSGHALGQASRPDLA